MKSKILNNLNQIIFSIIIVIISCFIFIKYRQYMDIYEEFILFFTPLTIIYTAHIFKQFRFYVLSVLALSILSIISYKSNLSNAEHSFLLKFFLASQTAIMWMTFNIFAANLAYFLALWKNSQFLYKCANVFVWTASIFGTVGMFARWYESYLISPDVGHIPISNLYEVFILFCLMSLVLYAYYEQKFKTPSLGAFVLPIITSANIFILWYASKGSQEIQPLVPALQSWWMKIHVPANFIGYASFALAAMTAIAYIIKYKNPNLSLSQKLPSLEVIDNMMYKSIALGFAFFTLATILGALWAAEAWGGYWSWDPKEVWALIVWLNYAAWLHMRLVSGWKGTTLAWWALIGLLITTFAFLGVNMFLSGLHSYGTL